MSSYKDEINALVNAVIDDAYEGTGVNYRLLGRLYTLKRYEKACKEEYDKLRGAIEVPTSVVSKTIVHKDGKYAAQASLRAGSEKLEKVLLRSELIDLWVEHFKLSRVAAALDVDKLLNKCTTVGKASVVIEIIEDTSNG